MLVVDGRELLLAFLTRDGAEIQQAIWSGSPFLAFTLGAFMASEFNFVAVMQDPEMPEAAREVARRHHSVLPSPVALPGYQEMLRRLGASAVHEKEDPS
jgi:hypothetical protein